MSKNVLVVDDEPLMRDMLYSALRRKKMPVDRAENGKEASSMLSKKSYDIVITDVRMPKFSGMDLLQTIKKKYTNTDVIMLTAYGTIEDAVKATKLGAFDFVEKKENTLLDEIEMRVDKLLEFRRMRSQNKKLKDELDSIKAERCVENNFLGSDSKMVNLFDTIKLVADSSATVFIQGESGTGKELVARALHNQSPRRSKPFIKVNCAALPDGLIESELFGHEKGAFTGAVKSTQGKFELANGGTLLLDEISEMNPLLQAKLLRVLQEREFEKIGDSKTVKLDVRVVATTNRDIHKAIEEGQFREDLFYRLNVVSLVIPSLRERKGDIPQLAKYFVDKYKNVHNRKVDSISGESMNELLRHDWPGNVRELENTIERAVVLSRGGVIEPCSLFGLNGDHITRDCCLAKCSETPSIVDIDYKPQPLSELEKDEILKTLKFYEGNRTKTAEALEISIRTLRNKLNDYRSRGVDID
ncbi:MAG: hypothetical protein CR982_09765 [Candidatus Cloacimonadota bacterium]|nr:MAG: hypothetical protein CR982_09765 [Candidatus Cloacimonadota bacterium]PIE78192.1 MAG: hypothetical protein CSA15_09080 [Candidatus Delongbacteria bacterium]